VLLLFRTGKKSVQNFGEEKSCKPENEKNVAILSTEPIHTVSISDFHKLSWLRK
jgi:hypothetical protein